MLKRLWLVTCALWVAVMLAAGDYRNESSGELALGLALSYPVASYLAWRTLGWIWGGRRARYSISLR